MSEDDRPDIPLLHDPSTITADHLDTTHDPVEAPVIEWGPRVRRRRPAERGGGGPPRDPFDPGEPPDDGGDRRRPRVKKLRLLLLLLAVSLLALVSFVFGMVMAIASDIPALENLAQYKTARNSVLTDIQGRPIGILTGNENRILVTQTEIPPVMRQAIVAVEDRRFYSEPGVDFVGIARALVADVTRGKAVQGASTITQQFVKNALQAQSKRTIFEKLREAAIAFHLTRKWSKDKILTEYLNTVYFGNGAYGIEAAARTYFSNDPASSDYGCGAPGHQMCVAGLQPREAALLAGIVASPSRYDPVSHPAAALARRDLVLRDMYEQRYLTRDEYNTAVSDTVLPAPSLVQPPQVKAVHPSLGYFTTWVQQQVIDRFGVTTAFDGGLQIRTTIDLDLQAAAEQAINNYLAAPSGPGAAMVAIDNATGEVRALVGGRDYYHSPFNLATQGQRQPGSAFKAFVLAQALREGISPNSIWPSRVRIFTVPNTRGREHFVVHNVDGGYSGSQSLIGATQFSDNTVFAAVGVKVGTDKIAALAQRMGIRTPVSHNYAIALGGLKQGVTPLDMAHAYETLAHGGQRVTGTLASEANGPVGIRSVTIPGHSHTLNNQTRLIRVLSPGLANTEVSMLENVISGGTGRAAAIGGFEAGKTGTTENYGDAWFVGFNKKLTVAIWVGYPDSTRSMKTDFGGSPVLGGTFPAEIWHDFMLAAQQIYANRGAAIAAAKAQSSPAATTQAPATTTTSTTSNNGGTQRRATQSTQPQAPAASPNSGAAAPSSGAVQQSPAQQSPSPSAPAAGGTSPGPTGGSAPGAGTGAPAK